MKIDALSLILIHSLTLISQAIVLFVQYRVNKNHKGIRWCVWGTSVMAIGVIFMLLVFQKPFLTLAMLANPLVVLGQIFLYFGIAQLLEKKENKRILLSIFAVFLVFYYYYMFAQNSISARTVVGNTTIAVISILTAYTLFYKKYRPIAVSLNFTAIVYFTYSCFLIVRVAFALLLPPMQTYSDQYTWILLSMIIPIMISNLSTFGIIIILNQRLHVENLKENEKMQLIFNTSPDVAMITRLSDGLFIDVNNGFTVLTGYTHDEVIGDSTLNIHLWRDQAQRDVFIKVLTEKGICSEMEYDFVRKDGSIFTGMISARIIAIEDVLHIVSSIRDITESKKAEQRIQQLVQQLETERNAAQLNSITDSLTGLSNRRCFDEAFRLEFSRLKRSGSVLSLLMLDVDYFKNYNDRYGHLAGDDCLRQVARVFKANVERATDIVARYGGEEFVMMLPETSEEGASAVAEKIRKAVEELAIEHASSAVSKFVTVSIGVVSVYAADVISAEQALEKADLALYSAKKGGRNRVDTAAECTQMPC